jgi:hypothetical protein
LNCAAAAREGKETISNLFKYINMQATQHIFTAPKLSTPDTDQLLLSPEEIRVLKGIYMTHAMPQREAPYVVAMSLIENGHVIAKHGNYLQLSEAAKAAIVHDILLKGLN